MATGPVSCTRDPTSVAEPSTDRQDAMSDSGSESDAADTMPDSVQPNDTAQPSDSAASDTSPPADTTPADTTATDTEETLPPILLGLTLHLENNTFDANYFDSLDRFASTFEAYGGKLTLEPRDAVVRAAAGPPSLFDWRTLERRGHSIGSHAGIGGVDPIALAQFTAQAKMRYEQLVTKVDRLDHISGNCGNVDWVKGVVDAGFTATTAATVLCLYAMAPADRPAPYADLDCNGATDPTCHESYPSALTARMQPWRALSGATWLTDDPDGDLVIIPGSGTLPCLEEEATSTGPGLPTCTLTDADSTRALAEIDAAIAARQPDKLHTWYWVWGSWKLSTPEEAALDRFLRAIDTRVKAGTLRWASVADMLDAYAEWESTHR